MPRKYREYAPVKTLTTEYLRSFVKAEAKVANQRLVRLEQAGLTHSPAYMSSQKLLHGVGRTSKAAGLRYKESTKNLSRQDLEKEYRLLSRFNTKKTASVKEYKQVIEKGIQIFADRMKVAPGSINRNVYEKVWEAFGSQQIKNKHGSEQISYLVKEAATGSITEKEAQKIYDTIEKKMNAPETRNIFTSRSGKTADKAIKAAYESEVAKIVSKKKKKKKKTNRKR